MSQSDGRQKVCMKKADECKKIKADTALRGKFGNPISELLPINNVCTVNICRSPALIRYWNKTVQNKLPVSVEDKILSGSALNV